ncbi:translation protein [Rickenella mellea]|uniref:Translation protein n=1 Tax=Rickenella mellea TaxID=50990 RepID=A0A4Y7Q5J2_9AGAM|nr:translation protein [Rickenella mellea]
MIKGYTEKSESKLTKICEDISTSLTSTSSPRLLRQVKCILPRDVKDSADKSLEAYKAPPTSLSLNSNPRIPFALVLCSTSVFYYGIFYSPDCACRLTKQAFDNAILDIPQNGEFTRMARTRSSTTSASRRRVRRGMHVWYLQRHHLPSQGLPVLRRRVVTKHWIAARDFNKALNLSTETDESRGTLRPPTGGVQFHNVSFSYPEQPEAPGVQHTSLGIANGECVATVGASGSGKSTIAPLLQLFYEPSSGTIIISNSLLVATDVKHIRHNVAVGRAHSRFRHVSAQGVRHGGRRDRSSHFGRTSPTSLDRPYPHTAVEDEECTSALDPANQAAVVETIRSDKRRFHKNWYRSVEKASTRYAKTHAEDGGKSISREIEPIRKYCTVVRVLTHTQIRQSGVKQRKVHLMEIQVNSGMADKVGYAQCLFEQPIEVGSVVEQDEVIDVIAVTKGHGFEGVKHRRGTKKYYGIIKNDFLMLKGSVPGTKTCIITLRKSLMVHTSRRDLEKVQLKFIDTPSKFGHGAFQTLKERAAFLGSRV